MVDISALVLRKLLLAAMCLDIHLSGSVLAAGMVVSCHEPRFLCRRCAAAPRLASRGWSESRCTASAAAQVADGSLHCCSAWSLLVQCWPGLVGSIMVRVRRASVSSSLPLMGLGKLALRSHAFGIVAMVMIAASVVTPDGPGRLRPRPLRLACFSLDMEAKTMALARARPAGQKLGSFCYMLIVHASTHLQSPGEVCEYACSQQRSGVLA